MDRAYHKIISCLLLVLLCNAGCNKEDNTEKAPPVANSSQVFILCEGSYGSGNASFSIYDAKEDSVYLDVYKSVNGAPLGDVLQSLQKIDSAYYLCINNSDKVLVLDLSFRLLSAINVPKPRYILPVGMGKAYISSLYNDKIFVLNTGSHTLSGSVTLAGKNTEGMTLLGGKAYIACWDTAVNKVFVVNTADDHLDDSLLLPGRAPSEILVDHEDKLWVLSGNVTKGCTAHLTQLDPKTGAVLHDFVFSGSSDPVKPVLNAAKDSIYFIKVDYAAQSADNGVFRMSTSAPVLPASPFIAAQSGQYFWALGLDPASGNIYVGDPAGFIQNSVISVYGTDGHKKKSFKVGAGVGHFYFNR